MFCAFVLRQAITSSRYVILQLELQKEPKFDYNLIFDYKFVGSTFLIIYIVFLHMHMRRLEHFPKYCFIAHLEDWKYACLVFSIKILLVN